ncbi:MAG: hypothetical protein M1352_03195 [Patescibacteria group bacterium]|nr:hypothetical protein [Patescibacteria group bacterium]
MDTKIKLSLKFLLVILVLGTPVGFLVAYFLAPYSPSLISPASMGRLSPFASILSSAQSTDSGMVLGSSVRDSTLSAARLPSQSRPIRPMVAPTPAPAAPFADNSAPSTSSDVSNSGSSNVTTVAGNSAEDQPIGSTEQVVEDSTNLVITYLKGAENADGVPLDHLYNLMSQDFKTTYSEAEFALSFSGAQAVVGGVSDSVPKIYGANNDWAEQSIKLTLSDGATQEYTAVFHFENGGWKLYATEEL